VAEGDGCFFVIHSQLRTIRIGGQQYPIAQKKMPRLLPGQKKDHQMTDTTSSAGSEDFSYSGPVPLYLANCPIPDFSERLGQILNDDTAKARDVPCEEVATRFWGDPTSIRPKESRWGSRGSRSVNREKNVWFDHEANEGGNTIQLVQRELGVSHDDAVAWLLNPIDAPERCGPSRTSAREYRPPAPLGTVVATYDYVDETGTLLSQVVRYEPKTFRQRQPDGPDGWLWSVKNVRSVPYRLPEVVKAIVDQRVIVIVEGEKDVDALRGRGFTATCNAGGAKKWRPELTPLFRGAEVVLIPDNDAAGCEHANIVGSALENVAARVRVLYLSALPEKGDVSDWFARGHTSEELSQLIAAAPNWTLRAPFRQPETPASPEPEASDQQTNAAAQWEPKAANPNSSKGTESPRSDEAENFKADANSDRPNDKTASTLRWHGEQDPGANRKWLVKGLLPETGCGLISGQWGMGKTFVALDLAAAVMLGTVFANRLVKRRGGVLFLAVEGASEIPIRLAALLEGKHPEHKGRLPIAWCESCPTLTDKGAVEQLTRLAQEAADRIQKEFGLPLALIVIDTMSAAAGFKDENSSSEGQQAMNVLNQLSNRTGALVLACDHFGKAVETGTRGTSAKEAAADVVIACMGEKTQAGNVTNLQVAVRKLRAGATGAETAFRLQQVDLDKDEDGEPITSCVVDWSPVTVQPQSKAAKGGKWPKSTSVFRRALLTALELHGTEAQPFPGGATVRAVPLDKVHEEFDRYCPAEGNDRAKALANRRQTFSRSRKVAEEKNLIGIREIDGTFVLWVVNCEDGGPDANPKSTSA
jgi:RecA-family ATPase